MYWLLAIAVLLVLLYWNGVKNYSILKNEPLKGPEPWPYIGNLLEVGKYGGLHKMQLHFSKIYGRVYKLFIGRAPTIVVSDPEIIKQILLKEFNKFPDRPAFIKFGRPFNSGLFIASGETWKRIRSTLTPSFTSGKLKKIVPIFNTASDNLSAKIEKLADSGESVDCIRLFSLFALEVIMSAAFGYQADVQTAPDEEFVAKARNVFAIPAWRRFFSMIPFADFFGRFMTPMNFGHYFLQMAEGMVNNRIAEGGRGRNDFIQLMLDAQAQTIEGVPKLTPDQIAAQSVTFLIAGFETTGTTMSNTAYFLATHPDVQEKLVQELDKARENRGDMSLYDLAQNTEYLDKVLNEVLRLCPPGFSLARRCAEECTIEGVHFPKNVDVNIPVYVLHRDPDLWENPEEFDPEHFSPEAKEKRHPYSFMPFGVGPRQCIGMRFALLEIKMCLMAVLEKFVFERAPETQKWDGEAVLLLRPKDMVLRIRKR
ncbi:cytochrome P450 3A41 [Nematostella vectensis]|uniref:cytochrome P450 3A41 n=1 Tax=Nematostella vectensis TaxID=45351 RepID=UPI002076EA6F|nr:cytochrome P450 3A41 [Nematostella vectensis]